MYWTIFLIVFIGLIVWNVRDRFTNTIATLTLMSIGVLLVFWSVEGSFRTYKEDGYGRIEIVAIKTMDHDTSSGGGSFLGWTFSSNNQEQYVIMEKYDNGSCKKEYLNCSETYVVEEPTNNCSPRVIYIRKALYVSKWNCPWVYLYKNSGAYLSTKGATIYVPEGTIIRKMGIN